MDDPAFSRRWANIALVSHPLLASGSFLGFDRADIPAVYMPFLVSLASTTERKDV